MSFIDLPIQDHDRLIAASVLNQLINEPISLEKASSQTGAGNE
jgi:hypothetical protein